MAAVVGGIGVLGAVAYVWQVNAENQRIDAERAAAESRGEAPIELPDDFAEAEARKLASNFGAPPEGGGETKGDGASGAEQTEAGATGRPGGAAPGEVSEAERVARAQAVARAADDATRRSGGGERAISPDDVVEAMAAVKPLMKACYDQMLDDFPEASGRVTARFTLEAKDEVGEVEVVEFLEEDTQFDAQMKGCMTKALAEFTLPMAGVNEGSLTVAYPFTFAAEDEAPESP
jgi:hypothetical protein